MRVSFSMLSAWENRDFDAAIGMFLGIPGFSSQAMTDGKDLHDEWEQEVLKTGHLPKVFGGKKLNNPVPEHKIVKQITDWLTLSGVMDLDDIPIMYEYKSGKSSAGSYANGKQHLVYQILEPRFKIAEFYAFNQYTKEVTFERVHLNEETLRQGVEWVISLASDMRATLENLGYDTTSNDKPIMPA